MLVGWTLAVPRNEDSYVGEPGEQDQRPLVLTVTGKEICAIWPAGLPRLEQ